MMKLPESNELNTGYLARVFDNKSECYKLFWFKSIVVTVFNKRITKISYEELIDLMIADAWYMVTEYHLNLGPNDTLEKLIKLIKVKYPEFKSSEKEDVILGLLRTTKDQEIKTYKRVLTYNVPYRFQAPFLNMKEREWKLPPKERAERINQEERLLYYFSAINGMNSDIIIDDVWADYIVRNYEIILGWIEFNMIKYLQRRNPSVPGIADKLYPPKERDLKSVIKYWKLILSIEPIKEIYDHQQLAKNDISIDHFVPWSYVAHDEFWNLSPTTQKINSSKSNNLPDWDRYFVELSRIEYQSYRLMWMYEGVHKEFDKCAKEHMNNDEIRRRLFREGLDYNEFSHELESIVLPVYNSARVCGFNKWVYEKKID